MERFFKLSIVVIVFALFTAVSASADIIYLKNEDRISGKVIRMEQGKLVVKTDYAGEVTISWDKVERLIADENIKVMLDDGTALEGRTLPLEAGRMKLETEILDEASTFNLANITAINPEVPPPVRIAARINAGLEFEGGNSDTDDFEFDASFQARTVKSRYTVGGEYNEEKDSGNLTTKDWTANANYGYFISEKWFAFVRTKFEHDKFADLDLRSTLGAGAGYNFYESDTLNLNVGAGPGYTDENFIVASDNDFTSFQWFANYDQYFFDKLFQLFHNNDGYLSIENSNNWIVNTRQGIRFPLYRSLTATIQYNYDYDNQPSPDANADYDSTLSFLLGYEFKN